MSVELVTDPTEPGYNSFVSIEEADEYFAGFYFGGSTSWDEFEEDDKARLLITSSRALSTLSWTGVASGSLAFPRSYPNQYLFDATTPDFVIPLVCEWARWLWQEGPNSEGSEIGAAPVKSMKVGDLEVSYGDAVSSVSATGLPNSILSLLQPLSPAYLFVGNRARSISMRY